MSAVSYHDVHVNVNHATLDHLPDWDALLDQAVSRGTPGYRNASGFALACALRDHGLVQSCAVPTMVRYADLVNRPPAPHAYTIAEAMASLRSAYSHPRRLPTHPLYGPDGPTTGAPFPPSAPLCNPPQNSTGGPGRNG
jgi:hypothetical protein